MNYTQLKKQLRIEGYASYSETPVMIFLGKQFTTNIYDLEKLISQMTYNQFSKLVDEKILAVDRYAEYAVLTTNRTEQEISNYI